MRAGLVAPCPLYVLTASGTVDTCCARLCWRVVAALCNGRSITWDCVGHGWRSCGGERIWLRQDGQIQAIVLCTRMFKWIGLVLGDGTTGGRVLWRVVWSSNSRVMRASSQACSRSDAGEAGLVSSQRSQEISQSVLIKVVGCNPSFPCVTALQPCEILL